MNILGIIFIVLGIILFLINPRPKVLGFRLTGWRMRGIGGPVLIILGILLLLDVI